MSKDFVENIISVVFWILFAVSIVLFLWYVFGSSPTADQIIITWLSILTTQFFKIQYVLGKHSEQIKNLDQKLEKGLSEIKELIKSK